MNYNIFMDTASQQHLGSFDQDPALRPKVGDVLTLNENPTLYTITRVESNSLSFHILTESGLSLLTENGSFLVTENYTNGDTISLNYFVRIQNTSPAAISMKRDIQGAQNRLASARSQIYTNRYTTDRFRYR